MATAQVTPDQSKIGQASQESQAQGQSQSQDGGAQDSLQKFRELAMQIKQLQDQFPEGAEEAIQIMKSIQKWMTKTAGSAQRTPERPAPPIA